MNSNYRPTPLIDSFRLPLSHNDGRLSADGEVSALIFLDSPDEELSERVTHFAKDHGLCAVADAKRQIVKIHGSAAELGYAFNTQLQAHESDGKHYRVRSGHLNVPDEFHEHVVAVLGLDNRPVAKPYLRKMDADASPEARAKALEVSQIARAYDFPQHVTGKGQVIAIIELGGGYGMSNINSYFNSRGIPVPQFNAIGLDGASNSPGESDADGEVELDCEVAGAIAPGARFDVYFAQNTDQSFLDAISQAVHSDATIISISWGGPESGWTRMAMRAMNMVFEQARALGKNVFCASGDSGATDGETTLQVDFPASSPNVIACGGTTLILRADGSISSERVWNENASNEGCGGGGVSRFFAKPSYQGKSNVPKAPNGIVGRGVPDVSGNSDPESGYLIVSQGAEQVTGGTSATAPLFAGLTALLQEALGRQAGFLNPVLYSNPEACNDVVSGDNVTDGQGYKASTSWDCASGLGSVQGNKLLSLLAK